MDIQYINVIGEYIDVVGTRINFSEIRDFGIRKCEYIYRPSFEESSKLFGKRYVFTGMKPYAAIIDESNHKSSVAAYKPKDFKESVGKELIDGAITTIGDKLNIKAFKSKKYKCRNQAGRVFTTYLEDVPAVIMKKDGHICDVQKNDELYKSLGDTTASTIYMIDSLYIVAKQEYIFYGNGIDLDDVETIYHQITCLVAAFEEHKKQQKKIGLPKISIPQINKIALPFGKKHQNEVQVELHQTQETVLIEEHDD